MDVADVHRVTDFGAMKKVRRGRPTLRDVADKVGVHVSTVSRALDPNSRSRLAPRLVEKIEKIAQRQGYTPNLAARSLKTRRSHIIGVVIPDIGDPVFPPIIRGIEDALARSGYVAYLANTDGNPRKHEKILETMRTRGVDGFILASVLREDRAASRVIGELPVVTVSRQTDNPRFSTVLHDEDDGIGRIITHLVSLGHRNIAAIAGPQTLSTGFNRYQAFLKHGKLLGVESRGLVSFATGFSESDGERCTEELLVTSRTFTAIVCANDRLAVGAMATLRRHHVRCPEDISVTGFNDMPLADRLWPPLTTARVHHYDAGSEAADIIVDRIERPAADVRHSRIGVELIVRGSTAQAPRVRQKQKEGV